MDKWVIDIPKVLRWILVHILIVPRRKYASGKAYQTIFTERGSPLLFHLKDLTAKVATLMPEVKVEMAMRYGTPSIETGLKKFVDSKVDEILVFPLYPQYAESSTRSSMEECERVAKVLGVERKLHFVRDFYEHPSFISAYVEEIKKVVGPMKPQHLLLSFHGLPERHVQRTDKTAQHCLKKPDCCSSICDANRDCYRAQSYATARAITKALGRDEKTVSVSFQSRLGRTPWIQPFTDVVIEDLPQKGITSLAVACPSFVADCLETLEEIGDRAHHSFKEKGGRDFAAIPCPNSSDTWAKAVKDISLEHFSASTPVS